MNYESRIMNYGLKNFSILFMIVSVLIVVPNLVGAQGLLPDCGYAGKECGFTDLIQLINNIIDYLIKLAIPVAAGVFAYAGFLLMTTAVADKKSEAKKMIQKVFIGLAIVLAAWLITNTLTNVLIKPGFAPDLVGK